MRKKWLLVAAPLVALAVLFSGLPTLAQENTDDSGEVRRHALVIRAPHSVPPNEEMTLAVFDRASEEPVAEAGVWALPFDDPEALKAEIAALREAAGDGDIDWQSFLDDRGSFLGTTNEDGQLGATFSEEGGYLLVAFKPDYRPGFRRLLVGTPPNALVIRAPLVALPGEEITIGVFDRASEEPVAEAGVWALPFDDPEAIKAEIAALREAAGDGEIDWQSFLDDRGSFLGTTNEDGQLGATFSEESRYLLVAFKPGYRPAFQRLLVATPPKALAIDVAHRVIVGEEVAITVFDRTSKQPVAEAGVWAIARENSGLIRSGLAGLREHGNAVATLEEFETVIGDAAYLGITDQDGRLLHTFADAGGYFLVAFKPGSRAAFTPINVRPESGNHGRRPSADNGRRQNDGKGRPEWADGGRRESGDTGRPEWAGRDGRPFTDNGRRQNDGKGRPEWAGKGAGLRPARR